MTPIEYLVTVKVLQFLVSVIVAWLLKHSFDLYSLRRTEIQKDLDSARAVLQKLSCPEPETSSSTGELIELIESFILPQYDTHKARRVIVDHIAKLKERRDRRLVAEAEARAEAAVTAVRDALVASKMARARDKYALGLGGSTDVGSSTPTPKRDPIPQELRAAATPANSRQNRAPPQLKRRFPGEGV